MRVLLADASEGNRSVLVQIVFSERDLTCWKLLRIEVIEIANWVARSVRFEG